MVLKVDQILFTSFVGKGFMLLASDATPESVKDSFCENVVYKYWDHYGPLKGFNRAVYFYQFSRIDTIFGWQYNEGVDEFGRCEIPCFLGYYFSGEINDALLVSAFDTLERGPLEFSETQNALVSLNRLELNFLYDYPQVRTGVPIPRKLKEFSRGALTQGELIDFYLPIKFQTEINPLTLNKPKESIIASSIETKIQNKNIRINSNQYFLHQGFVSNLNRLKSLSSDGILSHMQKQDENGDSTCFSQCQPGNNGQVHQSLVKGNHRVRMSLNEEVFLCTTTQEIRNLLNVDRVVIYTFDENENAAIVAESVVPGMEELLAERLQDHSFKEIDFSEAYLKWDDAKEYCNGHIQVVDSLENTSPRAHHIEVLERLAVKAQVMAPIIQHEKMFGCLIAQQFYNPRSWQQHEIDLVSQRAMQVGLTLSHINMLDKWDLMSSEVRGLEGIADCLREVKDHENILAKTIDISCKNLRADRIFCCEFDTIEDENIIAEFVAPDSQKRFGKVLQNNYYLDLYLEEKSGNWHDTEQHSEDCVLVIDNINSAKLPDHRLQVLQRLAVKAYMIAPIVNHKKVLGLLIVQCSKPRIWQQHQVSLLGQLAAQLVFPLEYRNLLKRVEQASQAAHDCFDNFGDTLKL